MDIDLEFDRIDVRLAEYYTPRERAVWWSAPHPLLDGRRAMAVLEDGKQTELHRVLDLLDAGYSAAKANTKGPSMNMDITIALILFGLFCLWGWLVTA